MPFQNSSNGPSLILSALAAAAGCAAAAVAISHVTKRRQTIDGDEKNGERFAIPQALLADGVEYRDELILAVRLALKAGGNMAGHCESKGNAEGSISETELGVSTKTNPADLATAVDVKNEKLILDGIRTKFPAHKLIGEESTGSGKPETLTSSPTWIVDPIDGTTNFASGLPLTCISIGLCDGGAPVMGVVYAPATQELYLAVKGFGAFRNGKRIRAVADSVAPSATLSNAVVCFEFGYARSTASVDKMVKAVRNILTHGCRAMRSTGSGVLDICYVATGRFDVVYTGIADEGWSPWDYCAAMVVVEEAGCTIRSLYGVLSGGMKSSGEFDEKGRVVDGSRFDIYSKSMICGVNRGLVEECRRVVLNGD